ncbi:MAG TPA: hypothetical protein VJS19_04220 [Candidatus Dormibacteraeota bacterium]|nr:hypothetical protein [Candidatus Dormibacteraeota bacterium]
MRRNQDDLTQEELQAESGSEVPDREAMSLVNANLALPINAAIAANVLSDGSIAYANAAQQAYIPQQT